MKFLLTFVRNRTKMRTLKSTISDVYVSETSSEMQREKGTWKDIPQRDCGGLTI